MEFERKNYYGKIIYKRKKKRLYVGTVWKNFDGAEDDVCLDEFEEVKRSD